MPSNENIGPRQPIDADRLVDAASAVMRVLVESGRARDPNAEPSPSLWASSEGLCAFTPREIEEATAFLRRLGYL